MKRIKDIKVKREGKSRFSLKLKLSVVMLCGLLLAGGIFFCLYRVGNYLVWNHFTNRTAEEVREVNQDYVEDLQKYININRLSISDVKEKVPEWQVGKHVELVFYQDRDLIYRDEGDTDGGKSFEDYLSEDAKKKYDETLKNILEGNVDAYPVSFTDGTLLVTVVDGSQDAWSTAVLVISIIVAVAILMLTVLLYFNYVTRRIGALANTVQRVEAGEMDTPIEDGGSDEIGKLASDVNSMRNAVVDNMSKEREAWEANAGLITAMSHDIRTPLTVMLGYIELMELQNTDPAGEEYLEACRQNALKLKKLSDDMFSYFLVFGKRDVELDISLVDAEKVIPHMLEEHCVLLTEAGYTIDFRFEAMNAAVKIDTVYFNRVIDNIFSNIRKYAAADMPVTVSTRVSDGELVISIENSIANDISGTESNGIGIKTCTKIMEQLGGSFISLAEGDKFISEIKLPAAGDAVGDREGKI